MIMGELVHRHVSCMRESKINLASRLKVWPHMKHGKIVPDASSVLILFAGALSGVFWELSEVGGEGGGGMPGMAEAGPAAIRYPLSQSCVIGSSADALASSILHLLANDGISMIGIAHPRAVGVLAGMSVISTSSIWVTSGEGLGVATSAGLVAARCSLSLPDAM